MQFTIIAYDGVDEGAGARRMEARDAHLATIADYKARGHMILGAALLDDAGHMVGSIIVAEFEDRARLDEWLESEPYVVGKVWQNISVVPCRIAPSFAHLVPK